MQYEGQLVASVLARHARAAIIDEARRITNLPLAVKGMWIVPAGSAPDGAQSSQNAECAPAEKNDAKGARFSRLVHTRRQRNEKRSSHNTSEKGTSSDYSSARLKVTRPAGRQNKKEVPKSGSAPPPTD